MAHERDEPQSQSPVMATPSWDSARTHVLERIEAKLDRHVERTEAEFREIGEVIGDLKVAIAETREGQRWIKWLLIAIVVPTWLAVFGKLLGFD